MKTCTILALALFVAACGHRDPWQDLHEADASRQCQAAGHAPKTDAYDQCFDTTMAKLKDYR